MADPSSSQGNYVECRLESAHDLAALLSALQLREKDQKDQRVHCEASARGLKFVAQSAAKDVVILAWMFVEAFQEYRYVANCETMHLKLPVAPLLSCLQIFSDKAVLALRYPAGPSDELRFTLEEHNAVTECCLRTLVLDEAPPAPSVLFQQSDRLTTIRIAQPDAWYTALNEFAELDAPDVALQVKLSTSSVAAAIEFRAQTLTSDAEVILPRACIEAADYAPEVQSCGEITYQYLLSSVLTGCLRSAKDAKAVKVRFNEQGVMSNQFVLRSRGPKSLFCEALVCPLADAGSRITNLGAFPPSGNRASAAMNAYSGTPAATSVGAHESVGF